MFLNKSREQLKSYLHGEGIEIGALHNPLDLTGLPVSKISYVDRISEEELRIHYPELVSLPLVHVDILDDGSMLSTIPDNSLDFIIANHLIEHLSNPIQALQNWFCRLRPGGILYLAVPDKRFSFDKDRPKTTLQHLLNDYYSSEEYRLKRDYHHFVEFAEMVNKFSGKLAEEQVAYLVDMQYSIHYHTWDFFSFRAFIRHVSTKMGIPYKIVDYSVTIPKRQEFVFILMK